MRRVVLLVALNELRKNVRFYSEYLIEASLIIAARDDVSPPKAIVHNSRGRPLMLGQVDESVQRFLQATIQKWCC